jgi:hypothetical protein
MEFFEDGALEVSMFKYLNNVIEDFPEIIPGRAAHDKLFEIRDDEEVKKLNKEQALAFHHTVAQLLFMATGARQDIQTAVAFFILTTRVKSPDEDDWGKLKRVLKYLNGTRYLKLQLTVESMGMLKWYVDGSHNVHWDCKGHGGAVFTLGKGATSSYSRKVKSNTRSSRNCSQRTCTCPQCYGLCISFSHRDMRRNAWVYTKTTSAPNYSSRTEKCRAVKRLRQIDRGQRGRCALPVAQQVGVNGSV